jgi:manganese transport protein
VSHNRSPEPAPPRHRRPPPRLGRSGTVVLLGPAFVAAIAYVDPGNVATNVSAGASYGYLLVWVVVSANLVAFLVQYLAAKLSLATGRTLPELCRQRYSRPAALGLWCQAELVAVATDLAEVLGFALALNLLIGLPLPVGGVVAGISSLTLLALQTRRGQRSFEFAIVALLLCIVLGFLGNAAMAGVSAGGVAGGLLPRFTDEQSILLATGILGATIMPHAIYLHGALVIDRFQPAALDRERKRRLLHATRLDAGLSMAIAGMVNLGLLVAAAAALPGAGIETIVDAHTTFGDVLGGLSATLFALALLGSGLASTAVGTYAGAVIMEGFLGRRIPLLLRRLATLVPAMVILGLGVEPTVALVLSQVVLSFGIPFALWPLVGFTADRTLMGPMANERRTTRAAAAAAAVITALNAVLIVLVAL